MLPFPVSVIEISSARLAIREATRSAHDRVDALYGAFDLSTRTGYASFLRAQAYAFLPVEREISNAADLPGVLSDWDRRSRGDLLINDLCALGIESPETGRWETEGDEAHLLGAAYVLEGSRLGGRVLAATVQPGLPASFLAPGDSTLWRALGETLATRLIAKPKLDRAIDSAIGVFRLFEQGASRSGAGGAND